MEVINSSSSLKDIESEGKNNNNNLDYINNFDISIKNPSHILNYHKHPIYCLSILNDCRLISSSLGNSIIIYNKTTYQPDLMINGHKDSVYCFIQLIQEY